MNNGKKCRRESPTQRAECRAALQQCNRATFTVRDLIERALPRRFVFSPSNDSCAVTKTVASEMIVGYFYHYFGIDRLPFAAAFGTPTTWPAGSVSGKARRFAQRFEFFCQSTLVSRLESGSEPDVM